MKTSNNKQVYYIKNWTLEEYCINDASQQKDILNAGIAGSPTEDKYLSFSTESDIKFETYITKDKLRGLAVFILNYLEKSNETLLRQFEDRN